MRVSLRVSDLGIAGLVEADEPGLGSADKVDNLNALSKVFVGGKVGVGGCSDHVVDEGDVLGDVLGGPVREEGVQKTLVSSIKGSLSHSMFYQVLQMVKVNLIELIK